jgi:hypothetical protein
MKEFIAFCLSAAFEDSAGRKEVLEGLVITINSEVICKLRMNIQVVLEELDTLLELAEETLSHDNPTTSVLHLMIPIA